MPKILAALLALILAAAASAETITVSAAISLKDALERIGKTYESASGDHVDFNFGASGALESQIEQAAPVDAFISAADQQVDQLISRGKAQPASRCVVAQNTLVLIVPAATTASLHDFADLSDKSISKIAIGQPKIVPAGQYAVQTLTHLKLLDSLRAKIVYGANVRQVLDYVVRDEVDAGIVYATDARQAGNAVTVIATAPADSHDRIEYPAVIISACPHAAAAAAKRFLNFLGTPPSESILTSFGFSLPQSATSRPSP